MNNTQSKEQNGQIAVIVGGGSGVGRACALLLSDEGFRIVVIGRRENKLQETCAMLPDNASYFVGDARDESAMREIFGNIGLFQHLLIPAAQTDRLGSFVEQITEDKFRQTFEDKFWAQINTLHAGAAYVEKGGSITLFSGAASRKALKGMLNIAAVNGALEATIPILALELAPTRVNIIVPGTLNTSYYDGIEDSAKQAFFNRIGSALPVGRVGTAEDIAQAALFLVQNGYTTGIALEVDGGLRMANL